MTLLYVSNEKGKKRMIWQKLYFFNRNGFILWKFQKTNCKPATGICASWWFALDAK